jgi:hypothetical protein
VCEPDVVIRPSTSFASRVKTGRFRLRHKD